MKATDHHHPPGSPRTEPDPEEPPRRADRTDQMPHPHHTTAVRHG